MRSKELLLSGDSGPRALRSQGALPSGVRPNSLVNKALLPAVSHFYAHSHPFPTDGAIPRTLVVCLCLSETPRWNPGVAHALLHRKVSTLCISFLFTARTFVYSVCTTTPREELPFYGVRPIGTNAEIAPCRQSAIRHAPSPRLSARPPCSEQSQLRQSETFK